MKAAQSGSAVAEIRKAIVNPSKLTRDRQLDVCNQCHLQTTALHSPDSMRRYDQPNSVVYFDYPGQNTFEIDHAAYRLAKSKCFVQSDMTCTTCHDPHQAQTRDHYQAVCMKCHAAAHFQEQSCVDCHMSKRRTDDVVHAVMTDHFIQRHKPAFDLLAAKEEIHNEAGEIALYRPTGAPDDELYLGVARARNKSTATLESAIAKYHPTRPEFSFELGAAYVKSGDLEKGIHWLEESLKLRPDFAPAKRQLGAALSDSGQYSRAVDVLQTLNDPSALTDLGGVYIQQRKLDQAEQTLQKAVALDPSLPDAFNLLGLERMQRRDASGAAASFEEAIRLQPDLAAARVNLGNLLASTGDFRRAIFHLKKADGVDAHYNLAQAYAASGSFDNAQAEFETAVRLKPGFGKAHNDLGRLLALRGKLNEAEKQFALAIQADSNDYAAHFELGRILAARGNRRQAQSHFERAAQSPDPELRQAAGSWLQK